jgi:hypothetical protein
VLHQPPLFTKAEDPLDADVWLRVVLVPTPHESLPRRREDSLRRTTAPWTCKDMVGPFPHHVTR